jgi:hypothetical protein
MHFSHFASANRAQISQKQKNGASISESAIPLPRPVTSSTVYVLTVMLTFCGFSPDYQITIRSSGAMYMGVPSVTDGYIW